MAEITRIQLGESLVEAELIAARAREAGISVELLRNEDPEIGNSQALGFASLLVRGEDEADLRRFLAECGY